MTRLLQMAAAAGDTAQTPTASLNAQGPREWEMKQTSLKAGASQQEGFKNTNKFSTLRLAAAHVGLMVILRMDCQSRLSAFSMERLSPKCDPSLDYSKSMFWNPISEQQRSHSKKSFLVLLLICTRLLRSLVHNFWALWFPILSFPRKYDFSLGTKVNLVTKSKVLGCVPC